MPATYWLPLPNAKPPVRAEHLHAAFSRWFDTAAFDGSQPDTHTAGTKPYSISPLARGADGYGVEINVLTPEAEERLLLCGVSGLPIRLGSTYTRVGLPHPLSVTSWAELATRPSLQPWELEFLTPTTFRNGNRSSAFPQPSAMLQAPRQCWNAFSGLPAIELSIGEASLVWVSDFDIESVRLSLNQLTVKGVVGRITLRCDHPSVTAKVAPLLSLAPFCGIGSFRGKGLGVVQLNRVA